MILLKLPMKWKDNARFNWLKSRMLTLFTKRAAQGVLKISNIRAITKDSYYKIIKEWALKYGKSPTKEDFNNCPSLPSPRTLEEIIKIPWNVALKELGLKQIEDKTYYYLMSKKELLEEFKKQYIKIKPSSLREFNKKRDKIFPSGGYVYKKLDTTWNGLLKLCNFKTTNNRYTKEEFKKILLDLKKQLNRVPSSKDFIAAGYTLKSSLLEFNLNAYNKVIENLNLHSNKTPQICNYTDLELINMYKKLCSELGKAATTSDIDNCKIGRASCRERV